MLTLHPMKEKDLPQVAAIEASIFSALGKKASPIFLHQKGGFLSGGSGRRENPGLLRLFYQSFDEADITNVAVGESRQGRGMARPCWRNFKKKEKTEASLILRWKSEL